MATAPNMSPRPPAAGGGVSEQMRIEQWQIDWLVPYARNARTHTAEQIGQLAPSIVEFGWTNPIRNGA